MATYNIKYEKSDDILFKLLSKRDRIIYEKTKIVSAQELLDNC